MNRLLNKLKINQLSFFLIALPYLCFNISNLLQSQFYNPLNLIILLLALLIIDITLKSLVLNINARYNKIVSLTIGFFTFIFFYSNYLSLFIQKEVFTYLQILIRGRSILEFTTFLFILVTIFIKKNYSNFIYLNIFLLFFSLISLTNSILLLNKKDKIVYKSNFIYQATNKKIIKPVILIISDEYTSPDDLYKVYKDSNIYNFSNQLNQKGWITKNSFYSYETSTIHSLSSMFNFNLSINSNYGLEKIEQIGSEKLIGAKIADSLEKKKVSIINFGIFHVGRVKYLNRLYLYPTTFFESFLMNTIYYILKSNTGNLNKNGFDDTYYPMEDHNKFIFNKLLDSIQSFKQSKLFVYTHLFMPHGPMQYLPEFKYRPINNLVNYKAYWNFTNQKLDGLLKELIKENKYKIILTGDHGYRNNRKIDAHSTFIAFYGFNHEEVNKIKSVQDLGNLICGSY